ncbi:hypothetical protein TcYC6_0110460 [Trypanosoma cruzi]|nr:hypothetical protein TcYC6_0110460 [Trypanosoma cruzi]
MEVECKVAPPSRREALCQGSLSRFLSASGRFTRFNAFLHSEADGACGAGSNGGTLYLLDDRDRPFSCIIIGPNDVIRESANAANAFSISRRGGEKTVLKAPSEAEKKKWMQIIATIIKSGDDSFAASTDDDASHRTLSSSNSVGVEVNASHTAPSLSLSPKMSDVVAESASVMKGVLLKKDGRIGRYAQRWFELRKGEGLFYAAHEHSSPKSFRCVPLQDLLVVFVENKRKIIIPQSASRRWKMTLKCLDADEFARWRGAIQLEISCLLPTKNDNESVLTTAQTLTNTPLGIPGKMPTALSNCLGGDTAFPFSLTSPWENSAALMGIAPGEGTLGQVADAATILSATELLELEDLQSDTPCDCTKSTEVYLESIGEKYKPVKNTAGMEADLQKYYAECLPYGFKATLQRLWERLFLPIREPYESVNEHLVLLDLDVERVRECLKNTLLLYGEEMALRGAVEELDYILRVYKCVREQLSIRLEIAAFREHPNQSGLPLGVNGTIDRINKLLDFNTSSASHYDEVLETWKTLFQALQTFRLEFDVFDESEETILMLEDALNKIYLWLQQNPVELVCVEKELR